MKSHFGKSTNISHIQYNSTINGIFHFIRAAWLEQENLKLRLENAHLKQENAQLRCQIYGATDLSNTSAQS